MRRVMKNILCHYGLTFCKELSDHAHLYSTLAQPWLPVAASCPVMNVRYITAQSFGVLESGLKSPHFF
jgi:hypothetical protein